MIASGTYTGDGAATQAVAGVGFQPTAVLIYPQVDVVNGSESFKGSVDGINAFLWIAGIFVHMYTNDQIISLDVDGFTVGDGAAWPWNVFNTLGQVYTYVCFR